MSDAPSVPEPLLYAIGNLSHFHREHEKFYSRAPLEQALRIQAASRALKALAAQWRTATPASEPVLNPFAGAEDLNAPGLVAESGILFMEGEGEPAEIARMKRDLEVIASDFDQSGEWLAAAMGQAWEIAGSLAPYPVLADLLGERHRIIASDWQAANLNSLCARILERAADMLDHVDFSPKALRADLAGDRVAPARLYSAAELIDHAADLYCESTELVHGNERRWRVFHARIEALLASTASSS